MRQALALLLQRNPLVTRERLAVRQARADLRATQGAFGLNLGLDLKLDGSNLPADLRGDSLLTAGMTDLSLQKLQLGGSLSLEKRFATGTVLSSRLQSGWGRQDRLFLSSNSTNPTVPVLQMDDASTSLSIQITQPLLRGGWLLRENVALEEAREQVQLARHQVAEKVLDLVAQTIRAYWELAFMYRQWKIKEEALRLAQQQLRNTLVLIRVGRVAAQEQYQARQAVSTCHEQWLAAREQLDKAQSTLRQLLHLPASTHLQPLDSPASRVPLPSLQAMLRAALAQNPQLLKTMQQLKIARLSVVSAKNKALPRLDLTAGFQLVGSGRHSTQTASQQAMYQAWGTLLDPRSHTFFAGVTLEIPLDNRQAKAQIERSQIEVRRAKLLLLQLRQQLEQQLRQHYAEGKGSLKRILLARASVSWAQKSLRAEQARYQAGRSTLFQVLQLQHSLAAAKLTELRTLVDYHKTLVSLYEKDGSLLKHFQIARR